MYVFYKNLKIWNDGKGNGANIANIYLNCAMVSRVLGEKQDEEGNISLYEVLSTICSELNLALGSVNNLEIVIEEETNSLKIIDANYQPVIEKKSTELQLYGYNGNNSNFVHSFDLKTEITNDFATMVSIGSTAGGYAKGMENTMFSKWNKGLIDIFKENYTPPKQTSTEKNIGIYYSSNSEEDIGWKTSFSLEYRKNIAGVKDENKIVPGIQISKKF